MTTRSIEIHGAREHNLKGIHVAIPREKLVVVTGPSGSGKSSLARDTLYAEGHRRFVECLSAEARQHFQQVRKPEVDRIEGLPPSICLEQRPAGRNPRSTVGTATELYDLLRLLYAKVGLPHCPGCGRPIHARSLEQMADRLLELPEGTRLVVLAPLEPVAARSQKKLFERLERRGFVRVRIDGEVLELSDPAAGSKGRCESLEVVVDRLVLKPGIRSRLADSIETAARLSDGIVMAWMPGENGQGGEEWVFSERPVCPNCRIVFPEVHPRLFSFNSPHGACPACGGLGKQRRVDPNLVVPNPRLSLSEGAIHPWRAHKGDHVRQVLESLAQRGGFDLLAPFSDLPQSAQKLVLYGSGKEKIRFRFSSPSGRREETRPYEGVIPNLERRYRETSSERVRQEIRLYMRDQACSACGGLRLRPEALQVRLQGRHIGELCAMSLGTLKTFLEETASEPFQRKVAEPVLAEIRSRLEFLCSLGLEYLDLSREVHTLSGGEFQRIQLATHVGSGLVGVLYILDEPTLGLHPRDTDRLLELLGRLRDRGNTVLVVEHDPQTILAADYVIDMGPGAGILGGEVIYAGDPAGLKACRQSVTGQFLSGQRTIEIPGKRGGRIARGALVLKRAGVHNLKDITVRIPVGLFTCVTGVSGSGKSSLVLDTLYPALLKGIAGSRPGPEVRLAGIEGAEFFDKVIPVDQTPLSRSPRSSPATYTGIFTLLRDLFAQLPEARRRGYGPARFSFNVKGGRCEVCQGEGLRRVEMHFLPDVFVTCDLCGGRRYNRETLEVRYRGRSISDVLEMTVEEARSFFESVPALRQKLEILAEVGLEYIRLGQPATTLSGGEAQRVKLARELGRASAGRTLYLLDEPTTGLHFVDIEKLLRVLHKLAAAGNTVVVIEHNLEVIKAADHVIDLGPEGGEAGGRIVVEGKPEEVARHPTSHTGRYLRELLDHRPGLTKTR